MSSPGPGNDNAAEPIGGSEKSDRRKLRRRKRGTSPSSTSSNNPLPPSRNFSTTLNSNGQAAYKEQLSWSYTPRERRFESVDFRNASSRLNIETLFPTSRAQERVQHFISHAMVVLVGLIVGVFGFGIDQASAWIQVGIYTASQRVLDAPSLSPAIAVICFTLLSATCLGLSASLCCYFSPVAAGSAIPEMKSYLNGTKIPGLLRMRTLAVKVVALTFAIGGGVLSGKQGPFNHIGAIIGSSVSQGASSVLKFRFQTKRYRPFRTEEAKRDFSAIGSAVGVSVAFGAPLGATLWALEEAVTHWSQPLTWITAIGCIVGAFTSGILANLISHNERELSFGPLAINSLEPVGSARLIDGMGFIILALIGGLIGSILPIASRFITTLRYKYVSSPGRRLLDAIFVGGITALGRFVISWTFRTDCKVTTGTVFQLSERLAKLDFSRFRCEDGSSSAWARMIYNPLVVSLRVLLHAEDVVPFSVELLSTTFAWYFIITVYTFGTAVPSGIFAPAMVMGATAGRLTFLLTRNWFESPADLSRIYAIVGAASSLGGVTRLSVSTTVLLLEASQATMSISLPTMFAGILAKFIADSLTLGVFDSVIALKGLPYFTSRVTRPDLYYKALVKDIMSPQVVAVETKTTIGDLVDTLRDHRHNAFPVFDSRPITLDPVRHNDIDIFGGEEKSGGEQAIKTSFSSKFSADRAPVSHTSHPRDLPIESTPEIVAMFRSPVLPISGQADSPPRASPHPMRMNDDERVGRLQQQLRQESGEENDPHPTTSPDPEHNQAPLDGIISRLDLLAMLDFCVGSYAMDVNWKWDSYEMTRENFDSAWPHGQYEHSAEEILNAADDLREIEIDLSRFADANPLLISDAATAAEAMTLLRITGARHALAVYTRRGRIVGIVTRADILEEAVAECLQERQHNVSV